MPLVLCCYPMSSLKKKRRWSFSDTLMVIDSIKATRIGGDFMTMHSEDHGERRKTNAGKHGRRRHRSLTELTSRCRQFSCSVLTNIFNACFSFMSHTTTRLRQVVSSVGTSKSIGRCRGIVRSITSCCGVLLSAVKRQTVSRRGMIHSIVDCHIQCTRYSCETFSRKTSDQDVTHHILVECCPASPRVVDCTSAHVLSSRKCCFVLERGGTRSATCRQLGQSNVLSSSSLKLPWMQLCTRGCISCVIHRYSDEERGSVWTIPGPSLRRAAVNLTSSEVRSTKIRLEIHRSTTFAPVSITRVRSDIRRHRKTTQQKKSILQSRHQSIPVERIASSHPSSAAVAMCKPSGLKEQTVMSFTCPPSSASSGTIMDLSPGHQKYNIGPDASTTPR